MSGGIDILRLFPDLAAIGQERLQLYCDEWLRRPMALEYGLAQIMVDDDLHLHLKLDGSGAVICGDRAFIPIDELLGYIIDRHFQVADKRRELHASVREARRYWAELDRDYAIGVGRIGTLWLKCKNAACGAELKTEHQAREGQEIVCNPAPVTCPYCGSTYQYEGDDLQLKVSD